MEFLLTWYTDRTMYGRANFVAVLKLIVIQSKIDLRFMAFSDFKNIAEVQKKYRIKYQEETFILDKKVSPPDSFLKDLEFYRDHIDIFTSEASRSEIIISPLLR